MRIIKIAHYPIKPHPILNKIEEAIHYTFENSTWETTEKTPL